MKTFTSNGREYAAISVPKDARNFRIETKSHWRGIEERIQWSYPEKSRRDTYVLMEYPGNKILGTCTNDNGSLSWDFDVEQIVVFNGHDTLCVRDYNSGHEYAKLIWGVFGPLESAASLVESLDFLRVNPYRKPELNPKEWYDEKMEREAEFYHYEDTKQWQEAQSQVFHKLLFLEILK